MAGDVDPREAEALDGYVEALLAGRKPPAPMEPGNEPANDRGEMLRLAALLNSLGSPEAEPSPQFVRTLGARLGIPRRPRLWGWRVSRRGLVGGVTGAFALLVAGALGDRTIGRLAGHLPVPSAPAGWTPVALAADVKPGSVLRFAAGGTIGHLLNVGGKLWAVSGICTDQPCVLQWQPAEALFECPCHGAEFNADGTQHSTAAYPAALPALARLPVQEMSGRIYVQVTPSTSTTSGGYR
ncbi:MAG: QcrA and Rieske domain-containing protein [Chloroflexota bacterium]